MKKFHFSFVVLMLFMAAARLYAVSTYKLVQKIPVPGDGGWDYLTIDPDARHLYISHSIRVQVMDIDQMKLIGEIPDTPGVHGIVLAPALNRGFTSNGKDNTVTIFDLKTLKVVDRVKVGGKNPDAILFDPATQRVFTFNGKSSDATAIEAVNGTLAGHVALGGKPEFAVTDAAGAIYVNLEDTSELLKLDSRKLTVKARWKLAPCEEPSALAMDRASNRLFVGCGNKKMVVVDATSGKVVAAAPIGEHVDAAVFDPGAGQVFFSNGDGTVTIIQEDALDAYHVVDNVPTQVGARTLAFDTKTHRLFLADADFGPAPPSTLEHPRPRPAILPGMFFILVVAQNGK